MKTEIKITAEEPIDEWWITGFDGGDRCFISISTKYAVYYLLDALPVYKDFIEHIVQKGNISKLVIEYVLDYGYLDPSYEDLCSYIHDQSNEIKSNYKNITIEDILNNAHFICKQIIDIDKREQNDIALLDISCIRSLAKLSGIDLDNLHVSNTYHSLNKLRSMRKVVTTPLVSKVFKNSFNEIFKCEEKVESEEKSDQVLEKRSVRNSSNRIKIKWLSEGIVNDGATYYNSVQINDITLNLGDCVLLQTIDDRRDIIACIVYFFEKAFIKRFHCRLFARNSEVILKNAGNPKEIFLTDLCQTLDLKFIIKKESVYYKKVFRHDYSKLDFIKSEEMYSCSYFYSKTYEENSGSFITANDILAGKENCNIICSICEIKKRIKIPVIMNEKAISWKNEKFSIGDFVLFEWEENSNTNIKLCQEEINRQMKPSLYTEYFRKPNLKDESNIKQPLKIGYIKNIFERNKGIENDVEVWLTVLKMFRPELISKEDKNEFMNVNEIVWSNEELNIKVSTIYKKCYVLHINNLKQDPNVWVSSGPLRFYFSKMLQDEKISCATGFCESIDASQAPSYTDIKNPLKTLDIFCGAGGFSEGLRASGLAEIKWAVELDKSAAMAFKANNPNAIVFNEDCNSVLDAILKGRTYNKENLKFPKLGEVELLIAGPPCQGFSTMNRFSKTQVAQLSNTLIANCLSFVDYYRPRFFILENVRAFVSHRKGATFKVTLACLLSLGYQCRFAIIQAGQHGVPQSRRRFFIIAAAPNEKLPELPEPQNSFGQKSASLAINVDNKCYLISNIIRETAPYRTLTVEDAISDLPNICNQNLDKTNELQETLYKSTPKSYYQTILRRNHNSEYILDHISRKESILNAARISFIPHYEGADWRDLPNIPFVCEDGTLLHILQYKYIIETRFGSEKRGVCSCSIDNKCNSKDHQTNTLIPWCLSHTAKQNNNWAGLFGRLHWNGVFGTTITSPEPMGKQGKVLHPEENRIISVRESARSQGFPDNYIFCGNISDKYKQIGNAVPPPLAFSIGKEIIKVIS